MAPNITVPMNFGKHLLDSPTHSTLELKAKNGATVRASSVILSFNSPVIDHMTTTLHLTSVDMEEFSEKAVRYFVDAAYSGETPPISRDMFRDINKMSHVFKVTWLVTRCSELFTGIAKEIGNPTYQDLVFLFDEAAFALAKTKSREIVKIAFNDIWSANGEEEFISRYIKENLHTLSHQQMDLILELTGATNVQYVVKPVTQYLEDSLSKEDRDVSDNYKYLLDKSDLYLCQQNTPTIAEQLFDVLEQVCSSPEDLKWVFQLHRKVMKKLVQPVKAAHNVATGSSPPSAVVDPAGPCSETVAAAFGSDTTGHAKEEIKQMFGKGSSKESQPTSGDASECLLEIKVLDSKYFKIECKIEEIQQKTNTLVVFNRNNGYAEPWKSSNFRTVSISGNVRNCKEAEVIIQKIVSEEETRSIAIWAQTSFLSSRIVELRQEARNYHVRVNVTNIIEGDDTKVILTGLKEDIYSVDNYIDLLFFDSICDD